jgi:hypothetical protein
VPTLESACGIPPKFPAPPKPEPIPAKLLAWWTLDETEALEVKDHSDYRNHARLVAAKRTVEGKRGAAIVLDGSGSVESAGLGHHEAVTVAMWVRPAKLINRWSPLLFTSHANRSAFHMSLLTDGTPNVAINNGGKAWVHRRAGGRVPLDEWHHVAVACDGRQGGEIRFYIDGRCVTKSSLSVGVTLDLDNFRIGAWKNWQTAPQNNFHGSIDEVRIYRGTLTDTQVAELVSNAPRRAASH